ncbi:MAG: hypothetical protein KIS92_08375 [Planctomycetota bacterium]|nr:hypothetical protein [Planctomycetota bacterium]
MSDGGIFPLACAGAFLAVIVGVLVFVLVKSYRISLLELLLTLSVATLPSGLLSQHLQSTGAIRPSQAALATGCLFLVGLFPFFFGTILGIGWAVSLKVTNPSRRLGLVALGWSFLPSFVSMLLGLFYLVGALLDGPSHLVTALLFGLGTPFFAAGVWLSIKKLKAKAGS